jgi:hypothetical protein
MIYRELHSPLKAKEWTFAVTLIAPMVMADDRGGDSPVWSTVVNNDDFAPQSNQERFFSYNPPSVNRQGRVVFRARAKKPTAGVGNPVQNDESGHGGQHVHGIFSRDMQTLADIVTIASNQPPDDVLPEPNNITHPGPATFNEFPAFPRIDKSESMTAFRGQATPSWEVSMGDEAEKFGGTSGLYAGFIRTLTTAIRNIEAPFFPEYLVPQKALPAGTVVTHFEQFPRAPTPTANLVAFKGNYSVDNMPYTGVFYRKVTGLSQNDSVQMIASSATTCIPNYTPCVKFGSTAPPSAADKKVVFVGWDNEEQPQRGGIYWAEMKDKNPNLPADLIRPLIEINTTLVPGFDGVPLLEELRFVRLSETLSFDGQYLAFWGTWGDEVKTVILICPNEGNQAAIKYCKDYEEHKEVSVPVHQGIFVLNTYNGTLKMAARADSYSEYDDFLYWNFSGRPPGTGRHGEDGSVGDDFEEPRWRSNVFLAVDGPQVAFKARSHRLDDSGVWDDSTVDGIYLKNTQKNHSANRITLLNTLTPRKQLDPSAPADTVVKTLSIERDGYRNGWLVINASIAGLESETEENTWAGIYLTRP